MQFIFILEEIEDTYCKLTRIFIGISIFLVLILLINVCFF